MRAGDQAGAAEQWRARMRGSRAGGGRDPAADRIDINRSDPAEQSSQKRPTEIPRLTAFPGAASPMQALLPTCLALFALAAPSRKQRHLLEARGLRKTKHEIHVLHRLAGRALDEIVERRP